MGRWGLVTMALSFVAVGVPVGAQGLDQRVAAADDGWITFRVEVADGVEVCERGVRIRDRDGAVTGSWRTGDGWNEDCGPGPLQVELEVRDGRIERLRARPVGPRADAVELGAVEPAEASRFLVSLAYRPAAQEVAEEGFFLARIPRGADPAPGILRAAGDRDLPPGVRKAALFWAGQLAADEVVGPLRSTALDDPEQSVREAAVFALSQHQGPRAVPVLMELATEAPHPGTRRAALFWLAQRDDPQVVEFLTELILGDRGG